MAFEIRMVFTFLKVSLKQENKQARNVTETHSTVSTMRKIFMVLFLAEESWIG